VQAEEEGEWVFTGEDGGERGPYSLHQLRKLLSRCAPWHSLVWLWLWLGLAGMGWAAPCRTLSGSSRNQKPCRLALRAMIFIISGCTGYRGALRATDMLHDEEAGVSVQVCCCKL
jgi:hypothetical protein